MESEDNRSDEYWMGVRDALRMVDSFLKWSAANKERAKPLEEFLYDGLVAAAKRCESCLHKQLGIGFSSKEEVSTEEPSFDSMPSSDEHLAEEVETETVPPEIVLDPEGTDHVDEVPIEIESEPEESDDTIRIEAMGSTDDHLEEETMAQAEPRDFSDDFRLVEPDALVVTPADDDIETPESEETSDDTEDIVIDETSDESPSEITPSPEKDEISVERPKYAWESASEIPDALEGPPPVPEIPSLEEPREESKVWSPMDDPSPDTLVDEELEETEDDATQPPPPPPPPESEESEEERRRRARRLFFGA